MSTNGHDPDTVTRSRGDRDLPSHALAVILKYLCDGHPVLFSEEQLGSVAGSGIAISWNDERGCYSVRLITAEEAIERMQTMPPDREEMN